MRVLYHRMLVPNAVYQELTDSKRDLPPAINLASMPWLIVTAAANCRKIRKHGEAQAMSLQSSFTSALWSWTKGAGVGMRLRQA